MVMGCFAACSVTAESPELVQTEYRVKAAFLYNYAKLVDWPTNAFATSSTPITIGVLGQDPFGPALEKTIDGKKIGDRGLAIKRFRSVGDIHDCHVLFICQSERGRLPVILAALQGKSILTVGECDHFVESGGMIQLIKQDDAVRFRVNLGAANRASLRISSKLLRVAERVVADDREENRSP